MKIISQTADELLLKEGGATAGRVLGAIFALVGAGIGVSLYSQGIVIILFAAAFFVGGLLAILFGTSITVDMNKTSGQLTYQKKRLVGAKTTTYAMADVLRIETRKQWHTENTSTRGNTGISVPRQVLMAQSVMVFKDGTELPLDHQKNTSTVSSIASGVLMGGSGAEAAIANQVASFLGVPFQEIGPGGGLGVSISGMGIRL